MRTTLRSALGSAVAGAAVGLVVARRRLRRWGAHDEEVVAVLPGDALITEPQSCTTRAVTVRAPVESVFPWLAQIGQGRGGFYSYDWLENLRGLEIHSADRILAEHQHLAPGDRIRVAPGPTFYGFDVVDVEAPSRLVLHMRIHPFTGQPIEATQLSAPSFHATWAFVLKPVGRSSTRLVSRTRTEVLLPLGLGMPYRAVLELVQFLMERRMLLGIRARAEAESRGRGRGTSNGP